MRRKVMLIDVALCHDCNNCFLACKDEHCGNRFGDNPPQPKHGHRWMDILRKERGSFPMVDVAFLPKPCFQCGDAPCEASGAVRRREDGIVVIDSAAAGGKRDLGCPYGAVYYNEEYGLPQKCDFCAHLLDAGAKLPRCVEVCPTGALRFAALTESEYAALGEQGYAAYGGVSGPSVLYKNLARFEKCFIGGSVVKDGDCLEGAEAVLETPGGAVLRRETNAFGDFKFDGLEAGGYTLTITAGKEARAMALKLRDSLSLGIIRF